MSGYPQSRPRRLRASPWIRRLVRETRPSVDDLIWPIVVSDTVSGREPVDAMPGVERLCVKEAAKAATEAAALGIPAVAIFPHVDPAKKDAVGSEALKNDNLVAETIRAMKDAAPDVGVIADVALDPFTNHGHDGVLKDGVIQNDETVERLAEAALPLAAAGADIVAPSDMMDGRVAAIRDALDGDGFDQVAIMSYAAKYASAFYGPYREAIGTATALQGDKRTYQMDPGNAAEALREVELDLDEGADMVVIKPGLAYLDIVKAVAEEFEVPTFAFQVSGEYAMLMAAAQSGWIDEERAILETLTSFKRAGAAGVFTYFAPRLAKLLTS